MGGSGAARDHCLRLAGNIEDRTISQGILICGFRLSIRPRDSTIPSIQYPLLLPLRQDRFHIYIPFFFAYSILIVRWGCVDVTGHTPEIDLRPLAPIISLMKL